MSIRSYGSKYYAYCDLICDKCGKKAYAIKGRSEWVREFMYEMGWRSHRPGRDYCCLCAVDVYGPDGLRELANRHYEQQLALFKGDESKEGD